MVHFASFVIGSILASSSVLSAPLSLRSHMTGGSNTSVDKSGNNPVAVDNSTITSTTSLTNGTDIDPSPPPPPSSSPPSADVGNTTSTLTGSGGAAGNTSTTTGHKHKGTGAGAGGNSTSKITNESGTNSTITEASPKKPAKDKSGMTTGKTSTTVKHKGDGAGGNSTVVGASDIAGNSTTSTTTKTGHKHKGAGAGGNSTVTSDITGGSTTTVVEHKHGNSTIEAADDLAKKPKAKKPKGAGKKAGKKAGVKTAANPAVVGRDIDVKEALAGATRAAKIARFVDAALGLSQPPKRRLDSSISKRESEDEDDEE